MNRGAAWHLAVGVAGVVAFVLTGQYMHWVHDHLRGMSEAQRLFLRSTHIYLMWAALLNLLAATGMAAEPRQAVARAVLALCSLALMAAPVLLIASFLLEPYNPQLLRPCAHTAIFLAFGAVLVRTAVQHWLRHRTGVEQQQAAAG